MKLTPHIHQKEIKAFADGHKIEFFNSSHDEWELIAGAPQGGITIKYRIYDPLREYKEALEDGKFVYQKDKLTNEWSPAGCGGVYLWDEETQYRIGEPKTVTKWQWITQGRNGESYGTRFFATTEEAKEHYTNKVIKKTEWTATEFEVKDE